MSDTMERTLLIVKPDGVQRRLIGEIISRVERRGFKIVGLKMKQVGAVLAEKHYEEHKGKEFFDSLVAFITKCPVVLIAVQGNDVVRLTRNMIGALNPEDAASGTIRGDLALSKSFNVIHGSDSPENAEREIKLFFSDDELTDYPRDVDNWLKV